MWRRDEMISVGANAATRASFYPLAFVDLALFTLRTVVVVYCAAARVLLCGIFKRFIELLNRMAYGDMLGIN